MEVLFLVMWSGGYSKEVTLELRPEHEKEPQGSGERQKGQWLQSPGVVMSLVLFPEQLVWQEHREWAGEGLFKGGKVDGGQSWFAGTGDIDMTWFLPFQRTTLIVRKNIVEGMGQVEAGHRLVQ